MSEKNEMSGGTLPDRDEQEAAFLERIREPRQAAREGRVIEVFADLTAQSCPAEIRMVAERALKQAERECRKLNSEQSCPESWEFVAFISLVFNVMAREYVRGLREKEALRGDK